MSIQTPNPADIDTLALASRSGWPEDLRVLIARFPREQWQGHANLGEMARFWLSRTPCFASYPETSRRSPAFRSGELPAAEFPRQLVPRLHLVGRSSTFIIKWRFRIILRSSTAPRNASRAASTCWRRSRRHRCRMEGPRNGDALPRAGR